MKKGKFKQRLLAVLLTAVMLLTGLPSTVLAAGDGGTGTLSSDVYVQNVDVETGEAMDPTWYPDDEGIIEIPVLDRAIYNNTTLGIKITGAGNYAKLDFSAVGVSQSLSINQITGMPTLNATYLEQLKTKVAETGSVDVPIVAGLLVEEPTGITLRFVNKHDNETSEPDTQELKVYYTPVNGAPQQLENNDTLTVPVPADKNGGTFSYEGLTEDDDYFYEWQIGDGLDFSQPISILSGKLYIKGPGTATVTLQKLSNSNPMGEGEILFSCEITAYEEEEDALKVYYTSADGVEQQVTKGEKLTVPVPADQKGGTLSYEGIVLEEGYWATWETSNEDGENRELPIYCEKNNESGKYNLVITGPGTVTVSLNQYQGNNFNDYTPPV